MLPVTIRFWLLVLAATLVAGRAVEEEEDCRCGEPNRREFGVDGTERIVGGGEAEVGEYPWQVKIILLTATLWKNMTKLTSQ